MQSTEKKLRSKTDPQTWVPPSERAPLPPPRGWVSGSGTPGPVNPPRFSGGSRRGSVAGARWSWRSTCRARAGPALPPRCWRTSCRAGPPLLTPSRVKEWDWSGPRWVEGWLRARFGGGGEQLAEPQAERKSNTAMCGRGIAMAQAAVNPVCRLCFPLKFGAVQFKQRRLGFSSLKWKPQC